MKIFISVQHVISIDQSTKDFLQSLFPDKKKIEDLTTEVKDKTADLKSLVDQNTPQT